MYTKSNLKNRILGVLFVLGLIALVGCNQQGRGFALPEGEIEDGKAAFVRLGCNECHHVGDIEWAGTDENLHVPLGGEVATQKSYGELVTSIINPSHKMSNLYAAENADVSPMTKYNEVMFVSELVNIVTFLQSEYDVETPSDYYAPYSY